MGRQVIQNQKQTNASVKIERENLSQSVNNLKAEVEVLDEAIKEKTQFLLNYQKDLDKKSKEWELKSGHLIAKQHSLDDLKKSVNVKNQELESLLEQIIKSKEIAEGQIQIRKQEVEEEFAKAKIELAKVTKIIETTKVENKDFDKENKELEISVKFLTQQKRKKSIEIEVISQLIIEKTKIVNILDKKENEVKNIELEIAEAFKEIKTLTTDKTHLQKEITVLNQSFKILAVKKEKSFNEMKKQERNFEVQKEALKVREIKITVEEKRIRVLGNTLQKHFNNNDMKHIKVFE